MKKLIALLLVTTLTLCLGACGQSSGTSTDTSTTTAEAEPAEEAEEVTEEVAEETSEAETAEAPTASGDVLELRLAVATTGETPLAVYASTVADTINEQSDGSIHVTVYDGGSLGGERDASEGVQMGTIDMECVIPESAFASFVPCMQVLALPFLMEDREHAFRILDSEEFRDYVMPKYEEANYKLLGFGELGFRQTTNNKKRVVSASDMKGLTLRVMEAPIWYKTAEALGATPTAVSFSELYTTLQQGVVDGQDNPITTIAASGFQEVQKYLILNNQTFGTTCCVMNLARYNGLTDDQRAIIDKACADAEAAARIKVAENEAKYLQVLRDSGIDIVDEPDMESFREATAGVYTDSEIVSTIGQDLIDICTSIE